MTTALYRRYRPQTFAEVIGQEHVTEPLMQALRTGRVGHAYLFSGPRGCGKTTSARILARCLNCEQGPTPTPCGTCPSCVALATGGPGSVDVIEIDAASHGGVDDARDLRERAAYGPAQSRFKVYIIDEAHMVTPQGFNALLKIVEEPPEHVKFVFATTEPEKVIGTIRSRTHHYPFRLVPPTRLSEYLELMCDREGVAVEPGVLSFVVRAGGGSVRDSLSVLDQLIAGSGEEGLTYAGAAALLGFTEAELLDAVVDALAAGDGGAVFRQLDKVIETGHDPRRFIEDLLERFRDLIIVSASEDAASAVLRGVPEDQLARMRQQAASFGPGELSRSADIVNAGLTELSGATAPRLQLELICARLLLPAAAGAGGYAARLDRLERRLDMAGPTPPGGRPGGRPADEPAAAPSPPAHRAAPSARRASSPAGEQPSGRDAVRQAHAASRPGPPPHPAEAARPRDEGPARPGGEPPRGGLDTDAVRRSWPDVLAKVFGIRRVTWTFLSEHAQVLEYDGRRLVLGIATEGLARTFHHGPHAEVVRQALIETLGVDVAVEGRVMPARGVEARPEPGAVPRPGPGAEARPEPGPLPSAPGPTPLDDLGDDEAEELDDPDDGTEPDPGWPADDEPGDPGPDGNPPDSDRDPGPDADADADADPDDEWAPVPGPKGDPLDVFAGLEPTAPAESAMPTGAAGDASEAPSAPDEPRAPRPAGGRARMSAYERAKAALGDHGSSGAAPARTARVGRPGTAGPAAADEDEVSVDDESIQDSGAVGQPVIAQVLGGVVIDEQTD